MMGIIVVQYNKMVTNYRKSPHTITTKILKTQTYNLISVCNTSNHKRPDVPITYIGE